MIPTKIATLDELGIPPVVKQFGHLRGGLVLVTGPTGSGKSTTLAALIDYINENFRAPHRDDRGTDRVRARQQAQRHHAARSAGSIPISFPDRLKAALREDADIVLVGEMRDLETISLALTAAETGLLVFGTLHTNNARKTVDRMIDVFPADKQAQVRTMLANSLRGVLAQLLLKKADGAGRLAVNEILIASAAVSAIIREGATQKLQDVIVPAKGRGCSSWTTRSGRCCSRAIVSPHEAFMKAIDKNLFKKFLPADEQDLGNSAGAAPDDEKRPPGDFVKPKVRPARR